MAESESEVPEDIRNILSYMSPDMRRRILADYETHYAPFLSMLAAWMAAVRTHYVGAEASAIARLQEQFFPLGEWKFPPQGLCFPQSPSHRTREILPTTEFTESAGKGWIPCGFGWLQPTVLEADAFYLPAERERFLCTLDIAHVGNGPLSEVLHRGQLAYVAADEKVLMALEAASWWVETANEGFRQARFLRYDGYMSFEHEMQITGINQRQLELWLPPFYPYSRKMALLQSGGEDSDLSPPSIELPKLKTDFRFVAVIEERRPRILAALRAYVAERESTLLFHLNAVPVIQARVEQSVFYPPFPKVGNEYALRMSGVPYPFAAVVYNGDTLVPATMSRVPGSDPRAPESDIHIQFAQDAQAVSTVKLYHGSSGQATIQQEQLPSILSHPPNRFTMLPTGAYGGASIGSPEDRADWARVTWYNSLMRPPLLSEGDLAELLRLQRGLPRDMLRLQYATMEILADPTVGRSHWQSYLWPTLIGDERSFETEGGIPSPYVPLLQYLRLAFTRGLEATDLPSYLLADAANYLASTVSRHFALACFQVDGRIV